LWWTIVSWHYRYRILSAYCTMWWTIVSWHYRYRILSDYCTMWWTIVTWHYRYRILSDYCTMWWTIVTWHWRHLNLSDYSTILYIASLNNENCTLQQIFVCSLQFLQQNSYNFPKLHFNLQLFHIQQTVRTAAWTQSLYPQTKYFKFNLH